MSKKYKYNEEEIEKIKEAMRKEKTASIKERLQAVYMTSQKMKQGEIAVLLNRSRDFVRLWVKRYQEDGLKELLQER